MKTSKLRTISGMFALALIVTLALTACPADTNSGETPTARSAGTEKPLTFGTNCKVTIKSDDKFTNAEWNELCDKVVAAIGSGHSKVGVGDKAGYAALFASGQATVILGNNFSNNWEVKGGEAKVIYIKTASIDTVDFSVAFVYMDFGSAQVG